MGSNAVSRLERSRWSWHDGVIAAHWQSVCERQTDGLNHDAVFDRALQYTLWMETQSNTLHLCGWRCPPSPWRTWNGQCRAWNRAPGPPGQESGLWSWPGTSLACHDNALKPQPSGRAAPSAHCCYWPWSHVSPRSAHTHQRAEKGNRCINAQDAIIPKGK